jgi:hypothetical protein
MKRTIMLLVLAVGLAVPTAASAADLGVTVAFDQASATSGVNVGQTVTATATITNTLATRQSVTVVYTLTGPNTSLVRTQKLNLKGGETITQSQSYTRDANDASGDYTLTVAASDKSGTTTASATVHYN